MNNQTIISRRKRPINTGPGLIGPKTIRIFQIRYTSSITQYGITWTFNAQHQYGQFVNGDYWVVGPVTIVSISHVHAAGVRDDLNGTMVNPRVVASQGYHPDSNNYDSLLDYSTQLPFTVTPGDSVVSTTGLEAIGGDPPSPKKSVNLCM